MYNRSSNIECTCTVHWIHIQAYTHTIQENKMHQMYMYQNVNVNVHASNVSIHCMYM